MARVSDRFVVRAISGYGGAGGSGAKLGTSYWVLDLAYAQVVARYYSPRERKTNRRGEQEDRRKAAEAKCRALNEQERRWLHSGRWT